MNEQGGAQGNKKGAGTMRLIFKLLPFAVSMIIGGYIGVYIAQQKPEWFGLAKGTAAAQAEVDALVARVGKLINLPNDEKPTVATVTDASKVKDQTFFRNAANGDKVLIYQKAQKAILFRPGENRIIEVGALNINQAGSGFPAPSSSPTPTPVPTPKEIATPSPTPKQ